MRIVTLVVVLSVWVLVGGGAARAQGLPLPAGVATPQAPAWYGFGTAWIASHAQRLKGTSPPESRKHCEGDLNGDGKEDVVLIYSIDKTPGGVEWTQFATVLTATGQGYGASMSKEVGGNGKRAVELCNVNGKTVEVSFKSYGPQDQPCCPSQVGKTSFTLEKGALVEAPAAAPSGS